MLERKLDKRVQSSRIEKLTVAVVAAKFKAASQQSVAPPRSVIRLFQPETVLKWHRDLVRRQWTYRQAQQGGRPRTRREIEALIVRFVRENADWGYGKVEGELRKLGYDVSEQTIANVLERHGIPPAPQQAPSASWRQLMQHYKDQSLA